MSLRGKPPGGPLLCYVTDLRAISASAGTSLIEKIDAAAAAGVDWIQIREKHLTGKELTALVRDSLQRVGSASHRAGLSQCPRVVVNDRLDVAIATQAGGAHLTENSLRPAEAKRLVCARGREKDFLVGVSCHSLEAARVAAAEGPDYLFFGPVFATPSKAAYGAPQGLERLGEVCRAVSLPVLAIGGITLGNAASCLSAGAAGIAAIRLFQDTSGLSALVDALRNSAP